MNNLPDLVPGQLWVVSLPRSSRNLVLRLAARLALEAPLRVLDSGNCFNVYSVAQMLRGYSAQVNPALERISVARAFTCYQVTTLLENIPVDNRPTLVLDLLATFYDESVPLIERQRLLYKNAGELRRLSQQGRVMVSLHLPPPEALHAAELQEILEEAADQFWRFEPQAPTPTLRLF
jgi:hypothetical protein